VFERFLKKNLDLKIISLVISTFLWLFVHLTQNASGLGRPQAALRVPIVIENLSPNLHVEEADPYASVTFTCKGVARNLESLKPSDFKASVDMEGKNAGAFKGLPVQVASPLGCTVTDVNPPRVEVVVDEEEDKTVPVTWEFTDNKNPEKISVNPREVVIKGSKTQVDRVVAAQIQIQDEKAIAIQEEYEPVPVDVLGRPVAGPALIPETVRVYTKAFASAKPVPVKPNLIGKLPVGMEIKSVSVDPLVVLVDSANLTKPVEEIETAPIDVTDKQGTLRQTVKLEPPAGAKIFGSGDVTVTVLIGKRG